MILPRSFYTRQDVVMIARELLGKLLVTQFRQTRTSGIICETEAYNGVIDSASHAFGGRRTGRTEIMYMNGGTAYVYLCYGIHSLFNIVTNKTGIPHAILIRAIDPLEGLEQMLKRSGKSKISKSLGDGPGKVSTLLGIHYSHTGHDLTAMPQSIKSDGIWVEDHGIDIDREKIQAGPRIGVEYAGKDAYLPYRFRISL